MSLTEKPKFLGIIIVLLLLLNFGTLAFLWTHHPGGPHGMGPGPGHGPDVFNFLVHELKLNDAQQKQYEQLRDEHHSKMESLHRQNRGLHDQLFALLYSSNIDSVKASALMDSVAANQKQMEQITFNHFRQVRAICTPEQQTKFDAIIGEAMRMMAPPPPGPPPHM